MSALTAWLQRWLPIAIHGAMCAGAKPDVTEDDYQAVALRFDAVGIESWRPQQALSHAQGEISRSGPSVLSTPP
jgi:hypothetical protein